MIEIVSLVKDKKFDAWLKKVGEKVVKDLKIVKVVSVVLVGDKKIRELNRQYRKKNKVTDVLSFGDWQNPAFLGEIVISLPQIKRQAKEYGGEIKQELARILIHGLLHLTGLNHEESKSEERRMFKKQDALVKKYATN
ncbi:MAG: rRNA maturation RNase YbeY [Patescibacteria group bacterium]